MYRLSKPRCFYVLYNYIILDMVLLLPRSSIDVCILHSPQTSSCVDDLIKNKLIHYTPPKGRSAMKIYLLENVMARVNEMD